VPSYVIIVIFVNNTLENDLLHIKQLLTMFSTQLLSANLQ